MTDKENLLISTLRKSAYVSINGYHKPSPIENREEAKKGFLRDFTIDITKHPEYLIKLLADTEKEKKDPSDIENILYLASIFDLLSEAFIDILISLMGEDWHYGHEWIAKAFKELKSPKTINVLYETCLKEYKYLDYDYGHNSLRLKCIWALGEINTPDAREKLELLTRVDDKITHERSVQMLTQGNIGPML